MTRFGLSNHFRKVSHTQFLKLALEFRAAVEGEFGTPFTVDIDVLSRPKQYISIIDDFMQEMIDEQNNAARIAKFRSLADFTPGLWDRAGYVSLDFRPNVKTGEMPYTFAHMEAKGLNPRGVSFYVQGGFVHEGALDSGEQTMHAMVTQNRFMSRNDGMRSNGDNLIAHNPLGFLQRML